MPGCSSMSSAMADITKVRCLDASMSSLATADVTKVKCLDTLPCPPWPRQMLRRSSAWMLCLGRISQTFASSPIRRLLHGIVNLLGVHSGVGDHRDKKYFLNTDHILWSLRIICARGIPTSGNACQSKGRQSL